jgi:hypothetical protein
MQKSSTFLVLLSLLVVGVTYLHVEGHGAVRHELPLSSFVEAVENHQPSSSDQLRLVKSHLSATTDELYLTSEFDGKYDGMVVSGVMKSSVALRYAAIRRHLLATLEKVDTTGIKIQGVPPRKSSLEATLKSLAVRPIEEVRAESVDPSFTNEKWVWWNGAHVEKDALVIEYSFVNTAKTTLIVGIISLVVALLLLWALFAPESFFWLFFFFAMSG